MSKVHSFLEKILEKSFDPTFLQNLPRYFRLKHRGNFCKKVGSNDFVKYFLKKDGLYSPKNGLCNKHKSLLRLRGSLSPAVHDSKINICMYDSFGPIM